MDEYKKVLRVVWDFSKDTTEKFFKEINNKLESNFKRIGTNLADALMDVISNTFKSGIKEMKSMLEFSQLSSSKTREYAFNYGFSSSEAYGFEKALGAVGLESEEDLFVANKQELAQFRKAFESYSNQYKELYDSGFFKQMQDYQFEMANFKNEMTLEVVKFFMNNKDVIKSGMLAIMKISEWILKIFSWLVDRFGETNKAMTTSEIMNQYSDIKTNNTNVNVNNNFNGVSKSDETWLADMGNLTYAQIIQALGGK